MDANNVEANNLEANNVELNNVEETTALNGKIKEHSSEPSSKAKEFFEKRWFLLFVILLALLVIISVIVILVFLIPYLKKEVKRDFRLPLNVIPEHYALEIQPYLEPDQLRFDGSVIITFICENTTDKIILHGEKLNIHENSLDVVSNDGTSTLTVLKTEYDQENQLIIFILCEELKIGKKYDIHIKFDGKITEENLGFFVIKYQINGVEKYAAATKFERFYARRAFPCFDEPLFRSKFTISIIRKKEFVSLSNMPLVEMIKKDEDWEIDKFQTSVVMPTYLVAYAIGKFEGIQKDRIGVWFLKNINDTNFILDTAHQSLEYFEKFLQVEYDLPKLDHVLIPNYPSLGMENWGLIMYSEEQFLRPHVSVEEKANLISHETIHQWFGNLVTPKWWDQLWLNEGFARYFGGFGAHGINPEWREEEKVTYMSSILMIIDYVPDNPLVMSIKKQDDFSKRIGITYQKGGRLVRMMHNMLGDRVFRKGLASYLKANAYESVDQDELWKHLTSAQSKKPILQIKKIMDPWTLQSGYPVVTAIRNYQRKTIQVTQKSCLNYQNYTSDDLWTIPITLIHGSQPIRNNKIWKWLTGKSAIIDLPDNSNWTLINVDQFGYFRVNYDETNWKLLLWQLRRNFLQIPSLNRIQILLDVMFFADEGELPHSLALDIFSYFPYEKDILVLNIIEVYGIQKYLMKYTMAVFNTDVQEKWNTFMQYALKPIYIRHLQHWAEGKFDEKLFSSKDSYIYFLCKSGYKDCITSARNIMNDIINGKNRNETNIFFDVKCSFILYGNKRDWHNAYEFYTKISDEREKMQIKQILTCTTDDDLIQLYLDKVWDPDTFISYMTVKNLNKLIEHLQRKWTSIPKTKYKEIIDNIIFQINTVESYKMLKEFYEERKQDLDEAERKQIEESMEKQYEFVLKNNKIYKGIAEWLRNENWSKINPN